MSNPYAPTVGPLTLQSQKSYLIGDLGRLVLLVAIFFVVAYGVSLPFSTMLTKDLNLIAMSPFLPMALIAGAIFGESIWTLLITFFAIPLGVCMVVGVLGVRKKRALVASILLGALYGLLLRLFYLICNIA